MSVSFFLLVWLEEADPRGRRGLGLFFICVSRADGPARSSRIGQSGRSSPWHCATRVRERAAQPFELGDLAVDAAQMGLGQRLDIGAGTRAVLVERKQRATFLDREPEGAGAGEEPQLVHVGFDERAVAVLAPHRMDEADVLVVADRLCREPAGLRQRQLSSWPPPRHSHKGSCCGKVKSHASLTFQSLETLHSRVTKSTKGFAVEPVTTVEETARDPVCGMSVERAGARHTVRSTRGRRSISAAPGAAERFAAAPEDFLRRAPGAGARARGQPLHLPRWTPRSCNPHAGDCPICGMALEPIDAGGRRGAVSPNCATCAADSGSPHHSPAAVFALEMGSHAGIPFDSWLGPRVFVALPVPPCNARAVDRAGVLPARPRVGAQPLAQHVDPDRARHQRRLALQPRRAGRARRFSGRSPHRREDSRRPTSRLPP